MAPIQTDQAGLRIGHPHACIVELECVDKGDATRAHFFDSATNPDHVIVAGGLTVPDPEVSDHETDPLLLELPVAEAGPAQVFGPRHVQPDDVAGMIDDPHLVGFRVVHTMGDDGFGWRRLHENPGDGDRVGKLGVRQSAIGGPESGAAIPPPLADGVRANYPPPGREVKIQGCLRAVPAAAYLGGVHCERLVVVGDAHLGRESPEVERALLAFLEAVPRLGDGLLVTGDLFEFWFTWRRAVPRRGVRVVAALAALRARVPILLVGGNHDRWGSDFWARELDIEFAPLAAQFTLGGRPALALHGDGITESHWSARMLHRITGHPVTIGGVRLLHPDLACWLVDRLSGVLGKTRRDPAAIETAAQRQHGWASQALEEQAELGLVAMGHTHVPAAHEIRPGRWYVNAGAWRDGFCYALVDDRGVELRRFGG